jgi:hypothetical protein
MHLNADNSMEAASSGIGGSAAASDERVHHATPITPVNTPLSYRAKKFPLRPPVVEAQRLARRKAWWKAYYQKNKEAIRTRNRANAARKWREMPEWRDRQLDAMRFRNYGITREQFDALLASQGGVCAICGGKGTGKPKSFPHVDHCHATGKVRGILCSRCNTTLAAFDGNLANLGRALVYLAQHVYNPASGPNLAQDASKPHA